jgi:hypothetical protein
MVLMHFTPWFREQYRGVELVCDWCNKGADDSGFWWYQRYSVDDQYPSNWVCNECKDDVQRGKE